MFFTLLFAILLAALIIGLFIAWLEYSYKYGQCCSDLCYEEPYCKDVAPAYLRDQYMFDRFDVLFSLIMKGYNVKI